LRAASKLEVACRAILSSLPIETMEQNSLPETDFNDVILGQKGIQFPGQEVLNSCSL
jgi:hypothetical protein